MNTHITWMNYSESNFFLIPSSLLTTDLSSSLPWLWSPHEKSDFLSTLLGFHSPFSALFPASLAGQLSLPLHCALWWQELAPVEGPSLTLLTLLQMFFLLCEMKARSSPTHILPSLKTQANDTYSLSFSISYLPRPREKLQLTHQPCFYQVPSEHCHFLNWETTLTDQCKSPSFDSVLALWNASCGK